MTARKVVAPKVILHGPVSKLLPVLIDIAKKRAAIEGELRAALERADDVAALRHARRLVGLDDK